MVAKQYKAVVERYLEAHSNISLIFEKPVSAPTDYDGSCRVFEKTNLFEIRIKQISCDVSFITFLHELGHAMCGCNNYCRNSLRSVSDEYNAWDWALNECRKNKIKITDNMVAWANRCYGYYVRDYNGKQTIKHKWIEVV